MSPMNRRVFLSSAGAALTAASLPAPAGAAQAPAISAGLPDVAVVGGGAFGAWTALWLREQGSWTVDGVFA